jgi:hypothetical protein
MSLASADEFKNQGVTRLNSMNSQSKCNAVCIAPMVSNQLLLPEPLKLAGQIEVRN